MKDDLKWGLSQCNFREWEYKVNESESPGGGGGGGVDKDKRQKYLFNSFHSNICTVRYKFLKT